MPSEPNEISYSDLHFQLGHTYSPSIKINLSDKFGLVVSPNDSIPSVVRAYDSNANTIAEYCTALNGIVNPTGELDVNWLIDSGESSLI